MFKTDSFISVLDRMLMILICSIMIWGHITETPFRIEWFVYAQTLAYSLTFLFAFVVVVKKAKFKRPNWNRPFFIMIIKQSFPFAILVLLMTFYYRSDVILLERILKGSYGNQQVGVYAMGFRLLDAANMIPMLFAVLLFPIFSRMIKMKEPVVQIVKLAFSLLFTLSVIVAVGSCFYNYELMGLLYDKNIPEASLVFNKLMFSFIAISTIYVFGTLLTANGNLWQLNIISAIALLVNFTINFILIPKIQAEGSAYANLTTQFIAAISQVILVQYVFRFSINYKYIASLVIFVAGVILLNSISKHLDFSWMLNFGLMIAGSLILASLLKLLNIKSLIHIIKNR
jgi:O-antigen/teichoic acid export membrane protein